MEDQKQKQKEYNKNYYEANKQKLLENAREKITCIFCNKKISKDYIKKHQAKKTCKQQLTEDKREVMNSFIKEMNEKYGTFVGYI